VEEEAFALWRTSDPKAQREIFQPVKVRIRIETRLHKVPINEHRYKALSGVALHVAGPISPQAHNVFGLPVASGHIIQEEGVLTALNELALAVVYVAAFSQRLLPNPDGQRPDIKAHALRLAEQIGAADILSINAYREELRSNLAEDADLAPDPE